jgi:hypothetical protein
LSGNRTEIGSERRTPSQRRQATRVRCKATFWTTTTSSDQGNRPTWHQVCLSSAALDPIGRTLMLSRFLYEYFLKEIGDQLPIAPQIFPLLSLYVEDIEVLSGYLREVPFAQILHNWIEQDPQIISTILAFENSTLVALGPRKSDLLDNAFDDCFAMIMDRLGLRDNPT